jgi:hypothetical protein
MTLRIQLLMIVNHVIKFTRKPSDIMMFMGHGDCNAVSDWPCVCCRRSVTLTTLYPSSADVMIAQATRFGTQYPDDYVDSVRLRL